MTDHSFVHLHVHTEYSLLDGLSDISKLVKRARALDMPALAITDHGTMFGVIDFYREANKQEIKPIIGLEGYVAPRRMTDRDSKLDRRPFHMLLLARNMAGYKNLLKIASAGQLEGFYNRPRVDREFLEQHAEGLIATSGCIAAMIPQMILEGRETEARDLLDWHLQVFGKDNFFIELQQHDIRELETINRWLIDIGRRDDIRYVATNDVHYVLKDDYDPHDTLLCIQSSALKTDTDRLRMSDNSYYLADVEEMWAAFGHVNDGEPLLNTLLIAEMCEPLNLEREKYHLPVFPVPDGFDTETFLRHLCEVGLRWRYGARAEDADLRARLDHELTTIHGMGFDTYFLIVWDLCEFARAADIWWNVRGSGAGSVAAYCLGITNIDPVQNNLLFERFLNPGRVSMPDIDLDYPDDRREDMIRYAAQKYGEDKVAAIITFGTLGAKAAVRDVGRALGVDLSKVNAAARLIPTEPKPKQIYQYIDDNPELRQMVDTDPQLQAVMKTAAALQGVSRHASTHAAGVIISDLPLVEYIPLHRQTKGGDDAGIAIKQVTQFPMETCEQLGLLKVDFLGLSTLTIMRRASDLIRKNHGIELTMDNIPYRPTGDPEIDQKLKETFELISRGETIGVFQVESTGMQAMLRDMRPSKFEHIVAAVSLYRPGPMDYIPTFNRRMHGEEPVVYHHPRLEQILSETYGICVYQEQIMQIAGSMFGYSLGDADLMRRAVSKKKKEDLQKHREIFLTSGPELDPTVTPEIAGKIFDDIEFFANYGFNKSHAADYAVITVQSAYMKAHYTPEYMAALLSVYFDDKTKVTTLLGECKRLDIPILPPDINTSSLDFDIQRSEGRAAIRFGMAAIKNVGIGAIQHILDERAARGPFRDLDEVCTRVDLRTVGKRALECLIKVGAFDSLNAGSRPQLLAALDRIISHSTEQHKAREQGQMGLFGEVALNSDDLLRNLPQTDPVSARDILNWERELLGIFVSSHPIDPVMEALKNTNVRTSHALKDIEHHDLSGQDVRFVGMVAALRKMPTKSKDMMGIVTLEDRFGTIDAVLFPRRWKQFEELITDGAVIVVMGKLDTSRGDVQIIVEDVTTRIESLIMDAVPADDDPFGEPIWLTDAPDITDESGEAVPAVNGNGSAHNGYHNGHGRVSAETTAVVLPASTAGQTETQLQVIDYGAVEASAFDGTALTGDDSFDFVYEDDAVPAAARQRVDIHLEWDGDEAKLERRMRRIDGILTYHAGQDMFQITLVWADGTHVYSFPERTTHACDSLKAELERVAGVIAVRFDPV